MPTNAYFNHFSYGREQDLVEDLTIESIKMYGHNVNYLPKTAVRTDYLFGEDTLKKYETTNEIEMYIKNVEGFEGEGDFLSKFNLQINDQVTFTVARKRFNQAASEKLTTEVGYNYVTEDADTNAPSRQFLDQTYEGDSIVLEEGTGDGYSITANRPQEGDLIYFPMVDKLFEIMFVEHEQVFYQTGRLQTYDLRCELFTYSNEQINTGNANIDVIEDNNTTDILAYEMLLEDDTKLLTEEGGSLMQEFIVTASGSLVANNAYFSSNDPVFVRSEIIDFSESNPFGEIDRY
jgi:hypothetical protein